MNRRALTKRLSGAVDVPSVGLGFALVAIAIVVLTLGIAPTAVGVGLIALLVVD